MSQTGISTHNQVEIAFLWRTFSLLQYFDDDDIFLEYFNEFLPHILKLRPLSLADEEFLHNSDPNDSTKKKYSFLSLRELQYLKSIDENSPSTPHFVAPLFEAFEAQYINGGRYEALMICLALAVKSGRSCLLVRCAVHLMKVTGSKSFNSLILTDLVEHVKATCPKTSLGSLFYGDEDFLAHKSLNVASSDDLLSTDMDEDKLRPPPVHAVLTFGKADHGKLGHPDTQTNRMLPTIIESLQGLNMIRIASMSTFTLALDSDGRVYVWGTGGSGSSGRLETLPQRLDAIPSRVVISDLACGLGHALFLTDSGRVLSFGNGGSGRLGLGLGNTTDQTEACFITALEGVRIVRIACGASHSLAVSEDGQVFGWGKNTQGQCGVGTIEDVQTPMPVFVDGFVTEIAAGWEHSLAVTQDGALYAWGSGYKDSRRGVVPPVLGLGAYEGHRTVPECVSTLPDSLRFTAIASGWDHCLAIDSNGKVLSWGSGQNGKLGHGRDDNVSVPTYIESLKDLNVISIATGCEHSAVVTDEGVVYSWGHGEGGRLGHGDNTTCPSPLPVQSLRVMGAKVSGLHCGDKFTVVLAKSEVVSSSAMSTSKAMSPETATVPSPFSERWFCNHLDADGTNIARILGPHPETESNNDAIQISGIQVSMMLLSLLTQATRTMDRRSRDLSQEGRYLPYVFERGNIYLGALLSLLETTSEKFYGIEKNLTDIEFPKVTDENFSFGDLLWQNSAEDIPSGILLLSKLLRNSCLLHNCLTLLAAALSAYDVEKATNGQILSGRKGSADRPLDRTIDEALSPFSPKQRLGQTQPRSLRNSREDSLGRSRSLRIEVSMGTREDEAAGNIINGSLNVSPNLASITGANTQTSDNANMSGSRQRSTREEAINRARLISRDRLGSALPSSTSPHRSRSRDHDDVAASAQSPPSIAVARFSPNAPLHYPQNSTSINLPIALRQQSGEAPVADSLDESSPNIGIALHPSRSTSILQLNDEHQQANGQQDDSIIQKGVTSTEHGNHISDINSTLPDTIRDSRYVSDDNAQEKLDESFDVFADTQPDPDADLLDVRILGDTILDMSDDDADSNKFGSNDIFEDEADPSNELGHPDDDVTADQLRENDLHANPIVKKELDYSFLQGKGIQFPESSVLVISIRNALEALSANTFALCGNLCFSSVQNERNNSIDSEATLIGMNLWHKIQVVMGQNFSVLYPDDGTQLSLFRRAVVSPFACASTLPAVSIGALALLESRQTSFKSLFSGSDILASLATVQKYLLMESLVNPEVTVNVNSTCLVQARLYFSRHLFRLLKVVIATLDIEASHAVANNSSPTLKISIDNETLNQIWSSIASCISKEIPQLFQDNMKATDNFSRTFTAVFLPCFDLTINMESVHVIRLLFPHLKTILSTLHSCVCVHPELSTQQSKRFNFVISKFRPLFAFSCSIIDLLQRLTFPSDAAIHEHMLNPNESNVESNKVIPWIEFLRSTKVSSDDEGWISDVLDKLSSGPKIDEVFSLGLLKASLSTSEKMSISNAVQERCKIAALDFTAWLLEIWTCDSAVSDVLNEEWKAQMHLGANMLSPLCSTTSTVSTDYLSIDFGKIIEKFDIQLSERFDIMMGFSKCSQTLIDAFSSHIDGILASQLSLKCSKSSLGFHFLRKCIGLLVAQLQKSPDELSQTIDAADTSPLEQLRGCLDLVIKILKLCPSVLSQEDGLVAEADEVHLRSLLNVISSGLDPLIIYLTDMLNRYQANIKAIYDHNAEVLMSSTKEIFNTSPTVVSSVCAPQGSFALGFWLHIPSSFGSDKSPSSTHLVSRMEEASELNMLSVLKLDGHARCTPTTALDTNGSGECFLSVTWATSPTEVATMSSHEVPLGRDKWVLCIVSAQQSFEKDKFEEKFVHGRKIVSKIIRRPVIDLSLHVDGALQCTKQIHTEQNSCFQSIVIGTVSQLVESKSSIKVADVFWSPMPDVTICGAPLCEQLQQLNQIWECICKTLTLSRHLRLLSPTEDVSFLCNIMKSCLKIVCLGDVVCSEEAFKTLESIVRSIKDETNADIRECLKYILQSLCGLASFLNGNLDSNTSTDGHHLLFDQWSARVNIQSWKLSRPIKTYVDSLNKLRVHETMFMSSVARLLWEAASVGLFDVSSVNNAYQYLSTEKSTENSMTLYPVSFDCITHILLICAGAWPSVPTITRTALVAPRALVLGENAKSQENYAFTEEVNISQVSNGRGLLLGNTVSSCDFGSSWGTTNDTLVPHLTDSVSSTELLLCQNNIDPLLLPSVTNLTQLISVPSSTQLNIYCKAAISKSENKTPLPQSLLPKVMGSLRALMTQAATFHTQQSSNHDALAQILSKNIPNIIAIASLDPLDLFEEMRKSGTLKSAQYDVLKSLLKEGDILFLEKISMKLWNGRFTNSTNIHSATTELESKLTMTVVAGDMQIQGSRVRALVHFPTAKLSDCKIGRRSGRWFYEVLLLSDGLIQIGWASNFFRCDPVSGQGVGDHASSWAYDGMRTKKWNVSCEPYGKRWKRGDVVGALLDMDLLEMRYFLNGEDLGASFVEFSVAASGLFPAISLNVRQSVRVNFGQFKFVHPPDEVDGKAYFPVMHAFQLPREDKLPAVTVDDAATVDSDSEHILTEENDKEFPQALFGSSTYEGSLNSLASFGQMDLNCVEETTQTTEQPLESSQSNVVSQISRENGDSDGEDDEGMPIDKQALIESLVAMGFSIEWASLAGNDPDASRSASAAIAWIIERVESARGNSADQDENDEDESLQDDEEGDDGEDCTGESLVNGGQKVYDSFATHTEGTLSVDEEVVKTTEAGIISYSVEVDGAWNSDTNYGPILAGYHSARRKYDSDKQEVLQQVTDLESREMPQIVACCQYTLITFYARAVLLYTISSINTKPVSIYEETLLTRSSWESLYRAMYQSYKHHVSAIAQPDRLLPSIERYNNNGEIRDRVPQYFPFISTVNEVIPSLSEALAALESLTLPHFSNDMCAEDSSIQGIGRLQTFLRYLVKSNTQSSNLLLEYIVTRASKELILAKTTAGRSSDWITAVANRDEKLYATCTSPEILAIFNHFLLRIILSSGLREPQSQLAIVSAFPVKTLTDLIRVGLAPSSNPSIRFCCLDVVSLIFAVVAQLDGTVAKQYASAIEPRHILKLFSGRFRQESHSHTQFSKLTRLIALLLCQYLRLVRIAEEKEDMSIVGLENLTQYQNESAHLALQLKRNKSQPAINTCAITISHSAAKSLNLSWNVQPEQVPAALTSLTLHVNEISLFHRSTSKRTFTKLSPSGFIEVDGLVPDSLYIVALQPQGSSNVTSDLYQIHVPSEPETGMRLDATHSAAPLVVLSNGLTVRNTVKKKWSTCRSALKMVSGFHRWDLQIDRCVSKNIFIGVVTADAKMDGYVGSDRHGWAFLSNKAIWHGKAKTKTYGELFRTGDIITTVLDLDRGTLSFALNGRDMGIAAEGLVGPLYAALSLYNDDDQVTLLEHNPSTSSGDEWSGGSAERVLERLVMLQQSLASIRLGYSSDQDDIDTKTGMKAVKNEVDLRGKLLSSGMTSRSFLSGNDFITLVRSPELCQEFTAGQLSLGDQVGTPCGRGMVAGVAGSKLYIQLESGDEYYSLYRELFRNLWITCGIHLVSRASEVKAPRDDWRFNWVHFINKEASLAFGCNISSSWTLEQDKYLVAWMNVVSDSSRCHPLDLPLWVFMESIMSLLDQSTTIATAVTGDMNKKSDEFMLFFKTQTLDIVARRIVVILHVNDLIGSLLPVCNLDDGLGGHDDCSSMLGGHKHLILSSVRDQVIAKIGKSLVSAKIQSLDDSESALTLHIQSPARMSASMGSAIVNTQTSEEQSYSSNLLSVDRRWNLIAAFQCSYLGQMFRWFEKLSQSQFTFQPVLPHHNVYCSSNWEIALRQVYANKGLLLSTSENDRPVPFTIALKEEDEINANSSKSSSGLIAILEQKHVSNGSVSNWTVFAEFVRVATEEINSLLESIYSAALSTNEGSLEAAIESIRANSLVVEALTALGVGEINLLCQIFRATGILIGLAERAGIKPSLRLPSLFQHILAPGKDEDFEKCHGIWQIALQNKALCCTLVFALALRNGVLAVLPDIGLRLRSIDDFASD